MKKVCVIFIALTIVICFALPASAVIILDQLKYEVGDRAPYDSIRPPLFDDYSCGPCLNNGGTGIQILAENFTVDDFNRVTEIKVWGGYWHGGTEPAEADFTVVFHIDSGGLPGADLAALNGPDDFTTSRIIGNTIPIKWWGGTNNNTEEIEYTFTFTDPVVLTQGTYWVEIYDDTTNHINGNDFFWRRAPLDPINGIAGTAWADSPNTTWWGLSGYDELAIEITAVPEPGTLLLLGSGLIGLTFYSRRKFRKIN